MCIFINRCNHKRLNDNNYDIYERVVTFDAPEVYSRTLPLGGKVYIIKLWFLENFIRYEIILR